MSHVSSSQVARSTILRHPAAVTLPVRYRVARPLERFEPYGFLLGWAAIFTVPFPGPWMWVVAFAPELALKLVQRAWRSRSPIVASPRCEATAVVLEGPAGVVERLDFAEVAALTCESGKGPASVRIERKTGRALVFELGEGETVATLASSLGLDATKARSRYKLPSTIARYGLLPLITGLAMMGWSWISPPRPELAGPMNLYIRYVLLPLIVLYVVPTQLDVGRDGVAWRWLFVRNYVAFSNVASIASEPANVTIDKVHSVIIDLHNGARHRFLLGTKLVGIWIHLREAFAESTKRKEEVPVDDWLLRTKDESVLAWTRRLRAIASGEAGYRGMSVAHLWAVADDLDVPVRTRAGAVFVLASTKDARDRVRVLATQVVDPAFSKLLEAVADDAPVEQLATLFERVSASAPMK